MELNKKAAYLQGLVDGLGVDESTKEGKIIKRYSINSTSFSSKSIWIR